MGLLFGPAWLARGEVFSGAVQRLGPARLLAARRTRPTGFGGGLDVPFETSWSRVVFVLLLLVSINFDGLLATPQWASYERRTFGVDARGIDGLRVGSLVVLVAHRARRLPRLRRASSARAGSSGGAPSQPSPTCSRASCRSPTAT